MVQKCANMNNVKCNSLRSKTFIRNAFDVVSIQWTTRTSNLQCDCICNCRFLSDVHEHQWRWDMQNSKEICAPQTGVHLVTLVL